MRPYQFRIGLRAIDADLGIEVRQPPAYWQCRCAELNQSGMIVLPIGPG